MAEPTVSQDGWGHEEELKATETEGATKEEDVAGAPFVETVG